MKNIIEQARKAVQDKILAHNLKDFLPEADGSSSAAVDKQMTRLKLIHNILNSPIKGNLDLAEYLASELELLYLSKEEANLFRKSDGMSLLHMAITNRNYAVFEVLLKQGADLHAKHKGICDPYELLKKLKNADPTIKMMHKLATHTLKKLAAEKLQQLEIEKSNAITEKLAAEKEKILTSVDHLIDSALKNFAADTMPKTPVNLTKLDRLIAKELGDLEVKEPPKALTISLIDLDNDSCDSDSETIGEATDIHHCMVF